MFISLLISFRSPEICHVDVRRALKMMMVMIETWFVVFVLIKIRSVIAIDQLIGHCGGLCVHCCLIVGVRARERRHM